MPGHTKLIAVAAEVDTPVVAASYTREIYVREDASVTGWPRSTFVIKKPNVNAQGIRRSIGETYVFRQGGGPYSPGDIAGYISLPAGAVASTFSQDEI